MDRYEYDAFVSYRSHDRPFATELVQDLRAVGLKVWFDRDQMESGIPWIVQLHEGVKSSGATIVLVGEEDVSGWMKPEVQQALEQYVDRGSKVLPVILPGVEPPAALSGFLPQYNWIDTNEKAHFSGVLDEIVRTVTGLQMTRSLSQMGEEYELEVPRSEVGLRERIPLFTVPQSGGGRKVALTWQSFGLGIEQLARQIEHYGTHLEVDACLGINDAGLIIATALNSGVLGRRQLGYFRTRKVGREKQVSVDDALLPDLPPEPTVLLADFVVKTGSVLHAVAVRLEQECGAPRIYFAAIGALTENEEVKVNDFGGLKAAEALQESPIEDFFIAATMAAPGISLPFQLL